VKGFQPLFASRAGVRHAWKEEADGTVVLAARQDVGAILEHNKAAQTHNDGYSPSREMARVASIPLVVLHKWMTEEGWDPFSPDPDCQRRLAEKLDSAEYRHLRTSELKLGDHWRKAI
jgi:hypothetical protein